MQSEVVNGPSGGPDETFRTAGMTNPAIVVPAGARVSIEVINADPDTAHGLVVTASQDTTWMPMMTEQPAFTGSALWFLGNPTSAGMHAGTLTFTPPRPAPTGTCAPSPATHRKEWPAPSPSGERDADHVRSAVPLQHNATLRTLLRHHARLRRLDQTWSRRQIIGGVMP